MPWVQKTTVAGNCVYVQKHYSSRYGSKSKCTRSKNYGKTPEAQEKVNSRRACMQQEIIFNANFGEGDWIVLYTFKPKNRPKDLNALKEIWNPFFNKIRRAYKKAGVTFKWMRAFEAPDKNPHIHMCISKIDLTLLPKWEYGKVDYIPVDGRDHHTYGGYLREETHVKYQNKGKYLTCKSKTCFSRSRNLVIPKPEYKIIYNDHWSEEPKARQGYYIVKDSINDWYDEVTGFKYQSYIMCKLPPTNKNNRKRE